MFTKDPGLDRGPPFGKPCSIQYCMKRDEVKTSGRLREREIGKGTTSPKGQS